MATSHVSLIKTWQWISHLCGCMSHVRRTGFHTDRISTRKPLTSVMCLMRLKCSIFPARHLGNINHNVINSPVRSCAPLVVLAVCADVAMWTVFKLTQIWVGVCHVCVCLSSSGCSNWFSSQRESKGKRSVSRRNVNLMLGRMLSVDWEGRPCVGLPGKLFSSPKHCFFFRSYSFLNRFPWFLFIFSPAPCWLKSVRSCCLVF